MSKGERLEHILSKVRTDQRVTLRRLSSELSVTEHTIRRDIKELSDEGLLKAVRGGAVPRSPFLHHFADRLERGSEEKKIIAQKAVPLIENGQVIFLDGGTTTLAIASILPSTLGITVVTNSFPIASVLENHPKIEVLFAGGRLQKNSFTTIGNEVIRFVKNIRADVFFMGICSIHPLIGVTTINYEESEVKKTMVETSKRVVALTTCERIGTSEAFYICAASAVDIIITDRLDAQDDLGHFVDVGIQVL